MMTAPAFIVETALLLLVAFVMGCVLGTFGRRLMPRRKVTMAPPDVEEVVAPVEPVSTVAIPEVVVEPSDDLKRIKGIGRKIEVSLNEAGVHRLDQIAAWNDDDARHMDERLRLRGRISRERWVEQAAGLAQR